MLKDYVLPFGKYRGETLQTVADRDSAYLFDLVDQLESGPTYRAIVRFIYRTEKINE